MYIPLASPIPFNSGSAVGTPPSLHQSSHLSLVTSGGLGWMGGGDAVTAMAIVHVYGDRRWLGWYNNPGSFQIAKRLCSFASSASFFGVFVISFLSRSRTRTVDTDPTALFKLDRCKGPRFHAAHSATIIEETGYMAWLLMRECIAWDSEGMEVSGGRTQPVVITVVDLGQAPALELRPARASASTLLFSKIPIITSVGAGALCALRQDWYASSLILVGILANGLFCVVLGSADLLFTYPEPTKRSCVGGGILTSDNCIVLLKGTQGAVDAITRGKFCLRFTSQRHYNLVRWCSLLFIIQCIAQLLLIPQASLFGQIMFLVSLGVSALYNASLSYLDKDEIHQRLLLEEILQNPTFSRYTLGTRTTAVVFMLLVLGPQDPARLLDEFVPDDTKVWKQWKAMILEQLRRPHDETSWQFSHGMVEGLDGFTPREKDLLETLYDDAQAAHSGYCNYLRVSSL